MTTYRASLGTRGELRRIAAEAETATIDRVRPWERKIQPCKLAPHVIVPQWIRSELPPKPRPSPVITSEAQIVVGETLDALLEAVCSRKLRLDNSPSRLPLHQESRIPTMPVRVKDAMQIEDPVSIHPIVQPQPPPDAPAIPQVATVEAPPIQDDMLAINDVDLSIHLTMRQNELVADQNASANISQPTQPSQSLEQKTIHESSLTDKMDIEATKASALADQFVPIPSLLQDPQAGAGVKPTAADVTTGDVPTQATETAPESNASIGSPSMNDAAQNIQLAVSDSLGEGSFSADVALIRGDAPDNVS